MAMTGRLSILAGGGSLPSAIAEAAAASGRQVHIVGIEGEADAAIARYPHTWIAWGAVGAMIRALRRDGCRQMVIAGSVTRPDLARIRPDLGFFTNLPLVFKLMRAGGDDAVLTRAVRFFEEHGLEVLGVDAVAPELIVGAQSLGQVTLPDSAQYDVRIGREVIAALGDFDVGQAVVIAGGKVLAIEGAEGTDRMIRRVGDLPRKKGGVLVKAPKPNQEMRVDIPTIGPETVARVEAARLDGIVVAAGATLALERSKLVARADAAGIYVVGLVEERSARRQEATRYPLEFSLLGRAMPKTADFADATMGVEVLAALTLLEPFGTGNGVAVVRSHVLAVAAAEDASAMTARVAGLGQWGLQRLRRRRGIVAVRMDETCVPREGFSRLVGAISDARFAGLVMIGPSKRTREIRTLIELADRAGIFVGHFDPEVVSNCARNAVAGVMKAPPSRELSVFVVAGEHSGDALGARLMARLKTELDGKVRFAGVGGKHMVAEGLASVFPLADVAVMGLAEIIPRLPTIVRRVYQTVDAAARARPDVVVIIDAPEFTHSVAKRIRRRMPEIPIIDYVSPSVWAWRPWRARRMRAYVDHVMALLPFEPEVHRRLGGPACTYVGHPLIERYEWIGAIDPTPLAERLGIASGRPVLVVLPGSRASEVRRLMRPFGDAIGLLRAGGLDFEVVLPVVESVRGLVEAGSEDWTVRPHLVIGDEDKFAAFKLARAALAASGTVTLELALAGCPMVVAYKVDGLVRQLRFLIKAPSIVLANLVLGENVFPEFIQESCAGEPLAAALAAIMGDSAERRRQVAGLAEVPGRMLLADGDSPSAAAARVVLAACAVRHR